MDCVWLADRSHRSPAEQQRDAHLFAERISRMVGIPLELEQHYDFIGFLPSRVHGAGSLTKYWAYGGGSFKVRGIEMRQHSTPPWISSLQERALEMLASGPQSDGLPGVDAQRQIWRFYRTELQRLEQGTVPLEQLVVTRRVTSTLRDYRVKNLTYGALMRAHEQGHDVPPGGKIRYVVVNSTAVEPLNRVLLNEELALAHSSTGGCISHYGALAERAVWAILAPFGWTNEQIRLGGRQPTLEEFTAPHDEAATSQSMGRPSGC